MAGFNYTEAMSNFAKKYQASTNAGYKTQGALWDSRIIVANTAPDQNMTFFVEPHGTGVGGQGIGGIKTKMDTNMQQGRRLANKTGFLIEGIGMQLRYGTAKSAENYQPAFTNLGNAQHIQNLHACGYEVRMYFQQTSNYQWSELFELVPSVSGFSGSTTTDAAAALTEARPGWGAYRLTDIYEFVDPYPLAENDTFQVTLNSDLAPAAMTVLDDTNDTFLQIFLLGTWYFPFA